MREEVLVSVATITPDGAGGYRRDHVNGGLRPGWGVSPERQQAIVDTLKNFVQHTGRLSPAQLRAVTLEIAARRDLWADLVVRDPDVRWYLPLHRSNACDVWLLAWERGQDTDWHDHGGSSGSFAVAEGSLVERYRQASGRRLGRRRMLVGDAAAFGPAHVHDVAHGGDSSATSIHAYSPPLLAMTYYTQSLYGLMARETVAIDGPEGARGRGGAHTALADATASAAELTSEVLPAGAPSIDELPAAMIIGRNVLEWRCDPRSEARIPALARPDARLIIMCSEGYASTLAAASLRRLGLLDVTDLDGGFKAWRAAGLPTRPAQSLG